jgi:hypothetical protein
MILKKAQSAFEYLIIVGLALTAIVPVSYIMYKHSSEYNFKIMDSRLNEIGRKVVDTAETVYFSGKDSKIVLEINMPKNVKDMYIVAGREIVFKVSTEVGENELVFLSSLSVPIMSDDSSAKCTDGGNCTLSNIVGFGTEHVKIESVVVGSENKVMISKFQ